MTAVWIVLVVAFIIAAGVAIGLECRDGRAWKHGPFAEETRRYTATDDEPKPPPAWDEAGMDLHVATAILQPDSELLPAEEAQR